MSSERVSRLLVVRPGYTAVLDPVTEDLYPRATPIELTGRVVKETLSKPSYPVDSKKEHIGMV